MIDEKKLIEELQGFANSNEMIEYTTAYDVVQDCIAMVENQPKADWIPCEERLPELDEGTESFKQSKCCLVALEWWDGEITEEVGWYNQSGVWNQDSKNCKVIAWQPLPAPYKKEGAE